MTSVEELLTGSLMKRVEHKENLKNGMQLVPVAREVPIKKTKTKRMCPSKEETIIICSAINPIRPVLVCGLQNGKLCLFQDKNNTQPFVSESGHPFRYRDKEMGHGIGKAAMTNLGPPSSG